jgi:hypothetical protein
MSLALMRATDRPVSPPLPIGRGAIIPSAARELEIASRNVMPLGPKRVAEFDDRRYRP